MKARARPPRKIGGEPRYRLRLYVTGMSQRSVEAVANLREICNTHLVGRHVLEIIDIYRDARRAVDDQIVASPTLVKLEPAPMRRFVGNLEDRRRVLEGLDLQGWDGDKDDSEVAPAT